MSKSFLVGVKGESHDNLDGTSRQEIIKRAEVGNSVELRADPLNEHDRWAVAVFVQNQQIGFLPSDARDASALLKGEPISAVVAKIVGGTNWYNRTILGKKNIGVVLKVTKGDPDWSRYTKMTEQAKPFDEAVRRARALEKSGDIDAAIDAYQKAITEIAAFTERDKHASAHRREYAPVDRVSLLLERQKRYEEAQQAIDDWMTRYDPVQPGSKDSARKRRVRIQKKLGKA